MKASRTRKEFQRFKESVSAFAEHHAEFLIVAKTGSGNLLWKASDKTWGIGAASRYINCEDARDWLDEDMQFKGV